MSIRVSSLPLYAQYFSGCSTQSEASPPKNWEDFKSQEADFSTSLSARQADFSIQDTTWVDTAKHVASIGLKIALFSYVLYPFAGYTIQRLVLLFQGRIVQLLQSHRIAEIGSKHCTHLSHKILTETAKRSGALALKIVLFTWALHTALRYIVQRLGMARFYPDQSRVAKLLVFPFLRTSALNDKRASVADTLNKAGFIVRDVALEKNGVRYSGFLIGHEDTINNGQWVLQATGSGEPIENFAQSFAETYKQWRFNTLLINGPSVGRSEGQATPESMGDAQEIGLSFIETALKASKVVIAGHSLGGAAIGQAILKHKFKTDVKYLVVRQMTFDRTSNIFGKFVGREFPLLARLEGFVAWIVRWAGCEMDSVEASQNLQRRGIKEVIVQATWKEIIAGKLPTVADFYIDGPILPNASLGYALINEKITTNKVFICLVYASHMTHEVITAAQTEIERL